MLTTLWLACSLAFAAPVTFSDAATGLRLDATPPTASGAVTVRPLGAIYGAGRGAFAPNLNAMVQSLPGVTLASFEELTRAQFEAHGSTVVEEREVTIDGRPAWIVSYDFDGANQRLRAVASAVLIADGQVVLTTGVAPVATWDLDGPWLTDAVTHVHFDAASGKKSKKRR